MRRRDFLRQSAATAAAVSFPYYVPSHVLAGPDRKGANDKAKIGYIGCGGRGNQLLIEENFLAHADVVAACDCCIPHLDAAAAKVPGGDKWKKYQNYRDMLDKEKLDAVLVATPTHARALICVHAMQAGLDVYAEKPLTLTVQEGQALIKAAEKHRRILQVGTQQRSIPINRYASKLVREGALGKVKEVIVHNFAGPVKWEDKPGQPVPKGMNWDEWINQTELRPYHSDIQYKWYRYRAYDGGGQSWGVTGWGTHSLDQVQCALGADDTGPIEIWPEEPGPNCRVTMRYAEGALLKLEGPKRSFEDLGAIFVGERGRMEILRGSAIADPPELLKDAPPPYPSVRPGETNAHIDNFFECMQTRKSPNADATIGHRSTTVCHLINICRELGRKLEWDPKAERFVNDDEANTKLSRPRREGYEFPAQLTAT